MCKKLFIYFLVFAIMVFPLTKSVYASEEMALNLIKDLGKDTLSIIANDKLSVAVKEKKLIELFEYSVDTKWIAKFVLGRYWDDLTEEKQNLYSNLHHNFLLQSYVPKFKTYTDQKIDIIDSDKEFENEYLIQTEIKSTKGPVFRVNYKVRLNEDGSYKIFDVVAEGISMITTQRSEFASIVSRNGVDNLIEKLQQRISLN